MLRIRKPKKTGLKISSTLHGLLLINKESGFSSHDVVAKARKILGTKEVGHCGTLDPLASGLLVLLVGQATKLSQYILDANKAYRVGLRLGIETDTLDTTGKTIQTSDLKISPEIVQAQGEALTGDFEWAVPAYSAVKVSGEKLYEKARRGETFASPVKTMKFWGVRYGGQADGEYFFDLQCSKGSYVRTWVSVLGQNLGLGGTVSSLVRTASDPFRLDQALTLEVTSAHFKLGQGLSNFVPLTMALPQVKRIRVQGQDQILIKNGQISYDLRGQLIGLFQPGVDEIVQILDSSSRLLAIVGHERAKGFHIRRVFSYVTPNQDSSSN